jgi:amino acid permease
MVGIGYLTLPANCKNTGLVVGCASVVVCLMGSLYGSFLLTKAFTAYRSESYPELVYKVLGKAHYKFITVVLILYTIFSTTMYIFFSQVLLLQVLNKYGLEKNEWYNFLAKTAIFLIATPLSLSKINKLKWISYISNFFSFFTAIVLIIQTPSYFNNSNPKPLDFVKLDINFFPALGACFFAFTNQFCIITLVKGLEGGKAKDTLSVS